MRVIAHVKQKGLMVGGVQIFNTLCGHHKSVVMFATEPGKPVLRNVSENLEMSGKIFDKHITQRKIRE